MITVKATKLLLEGTGLQTENNYPILLRKCAFWINFAYSIFRKGRKQISGKMALFALADWWVQSLTFIWQMGREPFDGGKPDFSNPSLEETHSISADVLLVKTSQHISIKERLSVVGRMASHRRFTLIHGTCEYNEISLPWSYYVKCHS